MNKTKALVLIALWGALLGIVSQLSLPLPSGIPLTLQSFAVALCGRLLGKTRGTAAVAVWLACGAVGLPLFSGFRGGAGALFGPTGGFLLGFLPLCFLCGAQKRPTRPLSPVLSAAGLLLCHAFGVFWFSAVGRLSLVSAFLTGSAPYLLKDLFCVFAAGVCAGLLSEKLSIFNDK